MKMYIKTISFTEEEKKHTLETFFEDGQLVKLPKKEKRKVIIFLELIELFKEEKVYSEKEINEVIQTVHSDFATIRRYLIDFKLLERSVDGKEYWVNEDFKKVEIHE
jgi:hypothetical protein